MITKWFKRKRSNAASGYTPAPTWFDMSALNNTFEELQTAVKETTKLASDISSQLEHKLIATEKQLSTILYVVTEGVIILDCDHIIVEWNAGAEIMFGYTKEEAVGKHIKLLCACAPPGDLCIDCFDAPHVGIREIATRHKSGRDVLAEVSINMLPSTIPGKQHMVVIMRDVTTHHAIMEVRESERKLMSAVLNSTSDVVIVRDGEGRWLMANAAARRLYGFVDDADFYLKTHDDIARNRPALYPHFLESTMTDEEAWSSKKTLRTEAMVFDTLNQRQYFDVIKTPIFDDDGLREMVLITARNITDLKSKREHITVAYKALNAASDIVCITDDEGKIVFVNKMFLIKYKFPDTRAVIGSSIDIVRTSYESMQLYVDMWKSIRMGKVWEGDLVTTDTQNNHMRVHTMVMPIVDQQLDASYYICVQRCLD